MDHEERQLLQVYASKARVSSSSTSHRNHYDVFLSFRGEDTRNNFTDHLYTALIEAGIHTFRDDDELRSGFEISSELLKSVRGSRMSIVVFSKNYAASTWCLDELVEIVECKKTTGQLVFPVFYDVEPSDVRKQTGSFADAFARHEERFLIEKVEKWRSVLTEVANVSGWDLQILSNRSEAKFIKDIVTKVEQMAYSTHLHVAKYPVGLNVRGAVVSSLLEIGRDCVIMVGICGMGGIGKTTTAKHVYNLIRSEYECKFEHTCFIADVSEQSKQPSGLVHLQEKLLSEVLKKEIKVGNVNKGISILKKTLTGKKVLIVLDDLDQIEQFESLAGHEGWFGAGSRILITTRDVHLLDEARVERRYKINELNNHESLRLFSWHAFREPVPLHTYRELAEDIVSYAGGLPLALEVVGSLLVKRCLDFWRSTLTKIKEITPNKITKILKLSYGSLGDYTEKGIFLDIACFFIGMDEEYAIKIFDACGLYGKTGIETLKDKCLLKLSPGNKLQMHDLVRDMGREIVRDKFPEDPGKRTRLWQREIICDVLTCNEGTEAIEGMILDLPMQKRFSTRPFAMMPNLRILQLNNVSLDGSFEGLFKKLKWLHWHTCPLTSLPCEFHPSKLVSLYMQMSSLDTLWQGKKFLSNLQIMNLSGSGFLTMIPDLSGVRNLVELILNGCESLRMIHDSIGCLDKLITLDLGECNNLKSLPSSIGNLRSLEELNLCGCSRLEELPEQFGNLRCLRILDATYTWIKQLPHSIGHLSQLHQLVLDGCENLKSLPSSICNLTLLERLRLEDCTDLGGLPENLGDMKRLRQINVSGHRITKLPDSIANLVHLSELLLIDCEGLEHLPSSICDMRSLHYLYLQNCSNLTRLPEHLGNIECLMEVHVVATAITQLPDSIGFLHNLKHLTLRDCKQLQSLPSSVWNLLVLEQLCLSGCSNLTTLNLDGYESVQGLFLKLQSLSSNVISLNLKQCSTSARIKGQESLKFAKKINLIGCSSLSTTTFERFLSQVLCFGRRGYAYTIYTSRCLISNWFDGPVDMQPDLHLALSVGSNFQYGLPYLLICINNETCDALWASYIHRSSYEAGSNMHHRTTESEDDIVVSSAKNLGVDPASCIPSKRLKIFHEMG